MNFAGVTGQVLGQERFGQRPSRHDGREVQVDEVIKQGRQVGLLVRSYTHDRSPFSITVRVGVRTAPGGERACLMVLRQITPAS